jgi:hypothetical protein
MKHLLSYRTLQSLAAGAVIAEAFASYWAQGVAIVAWALLSVAVKEETEDASKGRDNGETA